MRKMTQSKEMRKPILKSMFLAAGSVLYILSFNQLHILCVWKAGGNARIKLGLVNEISALPFRCLPSPVHSSTLLLI